MTCLSSKPQNGWKIFIFDYKSSTWNCVRCHSYSRRVTVLVLCQFPACKFPLFAVHKKPLIVGAVGPYGASLHDASEYTGSYAATTSIETMRNWHRPRIEALIEAGVDLLALETIPCRIEAEMLLDLIRDFPGINAWLAFSCRVSKHR